MSDLRLKFIDADGSDMSFEASDGLVTIGRHSNNSLVIADGRLSREHLRLEREGPNWYAEDLGSSNGTTLNGEPLRDQQRLKDGDKLSLGGLEIAVEIEQAPAAESAVQAMPPVQTNIPAAPATPVSAEPSSGGLSFSFILIAPALGLIVILIAGGVLYFSGKKSETDANDITYSTPEGSSTPSADATPVAAQTENASTPETPSSTPTKEDTATQKVEKFAAQFMRKAAGNDPRYFLTGAQAAEVAKRVQSMSGAVKANLPTIAKRSGELSKLAAANGLNPDFLAAAGLAKLGSGRGDAFAAASSMAGVFSRLTGPVGNELGDDCLLMVAAYDQGAAGDFLKLRNMLQDLATKVNNVPAREIRSIWYLNKTGKITPQEYELALRFLAAGTIMQDPASF
ncbi:MAG TPA: FHA domain-containing protein [Pyrinomonadaceae bacterium]|nr:FHA domain-containing protein [Pyrinomonadaceae bacterium]